LVSGDGATCSVNAIVARNEAVVEAAIDIVENSAATRATQKSQGCFEC